MYNIYKYLHKDRIINRVGLKFFPVTNYKKKFDSIGSFVADLVLATVKLKFWSQSRSSDTGQPD